MVNLILVNYDLILVFEEERTQPLRLRACARIIHPYFSGSTVNPMCAVGCPRWLAVASAHVYANVQFLTGMQRGAY